MASPAASVTSISPTVHEKFDDTEADRTIISSDHIIFRLHSKFLQVYASGSQLSTFEAPLGPSESESTPGLTLDEPAKILEILFEFVYPRRYPNLGELKFETLIQVAEAAEKYKVFNAMNSCEIPLKLYIPSHPAEILSHGIIHDYPKLANEAALYLSRSHKPIDELLFDIPEKCTNPWIRYTEAWRVVFDEPRQRIILPNKISCPVCRSVLFVWLGEVEKTPGSVEDLKALQGLSGERYKDLDNCKNCGQGRKNDYLARGREVMQAIHCGIETMPSFMDFMSVQSMAGVLEMKSSTKAAYSEKLSPKRSLFKSFA